MSQMPQSTPKSFLEELLAQELANRSEPNKRQNNAYIWVMRSSILMMVVFSILAYVSGEFLLTGIQVLFIVSIISCWNLTLKNIIRMTTLLTIMSWLTLLTLLYLLQSTGIHNTGILWALSAPAIFAFLKGTNSLFWNISFFLLNALCFLISFFYSSVFPYSVDQIVHLSAAFLFVATITYFTENHRLSKQLENNLGELDFKTVLDNASDIVCVMDPLSRMLYLNPAYQSITGFPVREAIGEKGMDFVHPDDKSRALFTLSRAILKPGTQEVIRYRYQTKAGGWVWLETKGISVRTKKGAILALLNSRDITEQVELGDALEHSRKMQAVGTLAGGIAHNVNNMLAAITNNVFMAKIEAAENPKLHNRLDKIESLSMQTSTMIDQLLSFARKRRTMKSSIDMKVILDDNKSLLRESIPSNITINWHISDQPLLIEADTAQIQQALINLVLNARDALTNTPDPCIDIELREWRVTAAFASAHHLTRGALVAQLTISDNGHGIPEDKLSHIFEPFFTTKSVGQGFGLGLSMVHGTIETHKGIITVQSVPEQGTSFVICIPLTEQSETNKHSAQALAQGSTANTSKHMTSTPTTGLTLLLVDDSKNVLESTAQSLTRLGFTITLANDGIQAIKAVENNKTFDAILLDIVMPKMGGFDAAKRIQELSPESQIIFYSAYDLDETLESNMLPKGTTMLKKPLPATHLAEQIQHIISLNK